MQAFLLARIHKWVSQNYSQLAQYLMSMGLVFNWVRNVLKKNFLPQFRL